jgi:hypothetical protein
MNIYTKIIAEGLKVDIETAEQIQSFMCKWFDDFYFGSSTKLQIIRTAKEAQSMMADSRYADLLGA